MFFNRTRYTVLFLVLLLMIFALGLVKMWVFINILMIVVCAVSYYYDRYFILFLYIIFLPTNGLISSDYNFAGVINLQRLLNLSAIIVLLNEGKDEANANDAFISYGKKLLFFFFIYILMQEVKNHMFQLSEYLGGISTVINRFIKHTLLFYSSILLIQRIKDEKINQLFNFSLYIAILFLAVSQIFAMPLYQMGFLTSGIFENYYGAVSADIGRSAGFYGIGWADQNSYGGFMAIALGFYLAKHEVNDNLSELLPVLIVGSISIVVTGSRTAMGAYFFALAIFFYKNWTSSKVIFLLLISIFGLLVVLSYTDFFDSTFERFSTLEKETNSGDNTTRIYKWGVYLDYMFSHPSYLFLGAKERIIVIAGSYRASHNLYLQILYQSGLFFIGYLFLLFAKFGSFAASGRNYYSVIYMVIPFIAITMTVSDWSYSVFLAFFIALNHKMKWKEQKQIT